MDNEISIGVEKGVSKNICYLMNKANQVREKSYSKKVYMRGLIELTNYCSKDCYYCGIRKSNKNVQRYRLTLEEVMRCCDEGYELGYRTFVLQGGEDKYFTRDRIVEYIVCIKTKYPDCAITLSLGEWEKEDYKAFKESGADRYLLRHESINNNIYSKIHPKTMSLNKRVEALNNLKKIGFQVGAGFMVGIVGQTNKTIVEDLQFLKSLDPHMVGLGPFIPHKDTPLGNEKSGTVEKTCILLAIVRLMLPKVLLPATTALATVNLNGREQGIKFGANVVMPNLSPADIRQHYALYDGKKYTGDEAAQSKISMVNKIESIGFEVDMGRGDYAHKT